MSAYLAHATCCGQPIDVYNTSVGGRRDVMRAPNIRTFQVKLVTSQFELDTRLSNVDEFEIEPKIFQIEMSVLFIKLVTIQRG